MICPAYEAEGIAFVPLPVDVFGAWHSTAIQYIKKIGSSLARATCGNDSITIQHLFLRLGIILVKGNINLIDIKPEINGIL